MDDGTSAQGKQAAQVLQRYFALLTAGNYAGAYRLRDNGSDTPSQQQLADEVGHYASYRADIGEPGRVQTPSDTDRFVEIPLIVTGSLSDGTQFRKEGRARLREAGGADGAASSWRIASIDFAATPDPSASEPSGAPVTRKLTCIDGSTFTALFDPRSRSVTLSRGGRRIAVLESQRPVSGIYYRSGGFVMRGHDDRVAISLPDRAPLPCRVS